MTHIERFNLNFALAILAFAASLLLFGCAPAMLTNPLFVAIAGGRSHALFLIGFANVLTVTLMIGAFARAVTELVFTRRAWQTRGTLAASDTLPPRTG